MAIDVNSGSGGASSAEIVKRNNTRKARVFDSDVYFLMCEILKELQKMNDHLAAITGEESINNDY